MAFCDHIIENVLSMLSATVFSTAPTYRSKMQTVQHVTHTLRLMPYRVILKLSLPGRLVVSCEDNETELFWKHGRQATGNVVLHEEKCMDLSSELLHGNRCKLSAILWARSKHLTLFFSSHLSRRACSMWLRSAAHRPR